MYHIVLVLQFKTMANRFKVQSYRKVVCVVVFFLFRCHVQLCIWEDHRSFRMIDLQVFLSQIP